MIVWLASYPRSGNTLLRALLYRTLGLKSLPERTEWHQIMTETVDPKADLRRMIGFQRPSQPWQEFYAAATQSAQCFLVKTHEAPLDDQPTIYVLRDGRKAIDSYVRYHRAFLPEHQRTVLQIIAGDDYYGDWSAHYRAWIERARRGPTLVLRFEELVDATTEVVDRIAAFLRHREKPQRWINPFEDLQALSPHFFREGSARWHNPPDWTSAVAWAFAAFHAPLMEELGYADADSLRPPNACLGSMRSLATELLDLIDNRQVTHPAIHRSHEESERVRALLRF